MSEEHGAYGLDETEEESLVRGTPPLKSRKSVRSI